MRRLIRCSAPVRTQYELICSFPQGKDRSALFIRHTGPPIMFQMPLYPMLDDQLLTRSSNEITDDRVWNRAKSQLAWEMYLGEQGQESPYAAPARADDLSGLPPTYTCVGDLDPFRDETIQYVLRLTQAGVPTEFHLYPGCFHGFEEYFPSAEISQRVVKEYCTALKHALYKIQMNS